MPYANEDDRRAYQRDYKRKTRQREKSEALADSIANPSDRKEHHLLLDLLDQAKRSILNDFESPGVQVGRGLLQLVGARLRVRDELELFARVEALEERSAQGGRDSGV